MPTEPVPKCDEVRDILTPERQIKGGWTHDYTRDGLTEII